jgi:hypothetical protein
MRAFLFSEVVINEHDLIKIFIVDGVSYIHSHSIHIVGKIIRLHHNLSINFEGIDVIVELINKINMLQQELMEIKKKLETAEN